ncbi:transposable element Tcb2 transposase [Trichonephila clavipes]|nr:transposable element Tcb2 transposase [Trichonephila clavipes]
MDLLFLRRYRDKATKLRRKGPFQAHSDEKRKKDFIVNMYSVFSKTPKKEGIYQTEWNRVHGEDLQLPLATEKKLEDVMRNSCRIGYFLGILALIMALAETKNHNKRKNKAVPVYPLDVGTQGPEGVHKDSDKLDFDPLIDLLRPGPEMNLNRHWNRGTNKGIRCKHNTIRPDFVCMDHDARPHRTADIQQLLKSEVIIRMDWLGLSPDLSPLEHVWDALGETPYIRLHPPKNTQQLKQKLIDERAHLHQEQLDNLVLSEKRLCEATIASVPLEIVGSSGHKKVPTRGKPGQEDHEERGSKDHAASTCGPHSARSTIRADVGVAIVPQTISRHLAEANLKSKRPFRALPLTPEHRQLRLQWCQARSMWNVTDWQKIVFSDESRFVLGTDDNRVRVWRCPGPFLNGLPGAIFQQDNARPHTARVAQEFLRHFQTLPWPTCSPDLSPVEHVWDQLKRQMPSCHSVHDLELAVQDLWAHLPQDNIRCLIKSMPDRVVACIATGGGPTRY